MEDEEDIGAPIMNEKQAADFIRHLYIFERDSKWIHVFDLQSKSLEKKQALTPTNFPHNF